MTRAGFRTVADFHRALREQGLEIAAGSVYHWTQGVARIDPDHVPTVARVLKLKTAAQRIKLHELPLAA